MDGFCPSEWKPPASSLNRRSWCRSRWHLVDFPRADFINGFYVIRAVGQAAIGASLERSMSSVFVINGVRVRRKGSINPALGPEPSRNSRVTSSEGKIEVVAPKLRAHVGMVAHGNRQGFDAFPAVFDDFPTPLFTVKRRSTRE